MQSLIDNTITDKNTTHSYLETYEKYFGPKKDTALNVLEIGIWHGGSIKLWSDYFTKATVYGLDINDAPEWLKTYDRIKTIKGDAYNKQFIKENFIDKGIKFDIIIDDGPHTNASTNLFVENYLDLLTDKGIGVIEDIQSAGQMVEINEHVPKLFQPYMKTIDLKSIKGRYDDVLIIFDLNSL